MTENDDFWKIKRSELEALKKKPIKIGLSDVCSSVDEIFEPVIKPMSKRFADEYEHKLLGFAMLHQVIRVYVYTENKMEVKDGKHIFSIENKFNVRRPKGKECICHDFTNLITMSEREFERMPHTENYEIAKMYREAMRSTPSVEKLLRQRRKQKDAEQRSRIQERQVQFHVHGHDRERQGVPWRDGRGRDKSKGHRREGAHPKKRRRRGGTGEMDSPEAGEHVLKRID